MSSENRGGRLEKTVPARKKTAVFLWIREFMLFKTFEDARTTMNMMKKKDKKCFWCPKQFEGSDMLFLGCAIKPNAGNVLLCRKCAELAQSSDL